MEQEYTTQRVYSIGVTNKLIDKGYKLLRVEQNSGKKHFVRFIFEYKEGIKEAMIEAAKR